LALGTINLHNYLEEVKKRGKIKLTFWGTREPIPVIDLQTFGIGIFACFSTSNGKSNQLCQKTFLSIYKCLRILCVSEIQAI